MSAPEPKPKYVCSECGGPRWNTKGSVLKLCRKCWRLSVKKPVAV